MIQDIELKTLKLLLLSQLTIEAMDDIKGSDLYNGKVKQYVNILQNILIPMLQKQVTNVYKIDPELTINLFNELDNLLAKLATLNVVDIIMINQIHDHYSKNPDDWKNVFAIEMNTIN